MNNSKIIEFGICREIDLNLLERMVIERMCFDWQPYEGIYETKHRNEIYLHQAMVKYKYKAQRNIADYQIVASENFSEIAGFINDQIDEGWQPWHRMLGVNYTPYTGEFFIQPLVMFKSVKKIKK